MKDYKIGRLIGQGTFGKVKECTHKKTSQKAAVKIISKSSIASSQSFKERVNREVEILKRLRHENVVQLYEIIEDDSFVYVVMELCEGQALFEYIVENKSLDEPTACFFFQQIVYALEHLHKQNIVHRDLKPENVLLTDELIIKLSDFGLSRVYNDDNLLSTPCGTPSYAPPEILNGEEYHGLFTDIWSCGITLFSMVSGYLPFFDSQEHLIYTKICQLELEMPNYFSDSLVDLLSKLLQKDPTKRIDLIGIKEHPWFNQVEQVQKQGLLIGTHKIPVDEKLMAELGVDKKKLVDSLNRNDFNSLTALYYLHLNKRKATGYKSVSDPATDEFQKFVSKAENLLVEKEELPERVKKIRKSIKQRGTVDLTKFNIDDERRVSLLNAISIRHQDKKMSVVDGSPSYSKILSFNESDSSRQMTPEKEMKSKTKPTDGNFNKRKSYDIQVSSKNKIVGKTNKEASSKLAKNLANIILDESAKSARLSVSQVELKKLTGKSDKVRSTKQSEKSLKSSASQPVLQRTEQVEILQKRGIISFNYNDVEMMNLSIKMKDVQASIAEIAQNVEVSKGKGRFSEFDRRTLKFDNLNEEIEHKGKVVKKTQNKGGLVILNEKRESVEVVKSIRNSFNNESAKNKHQKEVEKRLSLQVSSHEDKEIKYISNDYSHELQMGISKSSRRPNKYSYLIEPDQLSETKLKDESDLKPEEELLANKIQKTSKLGNAKKLNFCQFSVDKQTNNSLIQSSTKKHKSLLIVNNKLENNRSQSGLLNSLSAKKRNTVPTNRGSKILSTIEMKKDKINKAKEERERLLEETRELAEKHVSKGEVVIPRISLIKTLFKGRWVFCSLYDGPINVDCLVDQVAITLIKNLKAVLEKIQIAYALVNNFVFRCSKRGITFRIEICKVADFEYNYLLIRNVSNETEDFRILSQMIITMVSRM